MSAVSIGPFAFDGHRLAAVGSLLLFIVVVELAARLQRRGHPGETGRWAGYAVLAWVLGARAGFVAANWSSFAASPLDAVRFWQGGFLPGAGWAAGIAVFLIAMFRDATGVLKPLAFGAMAALIAQRVFTGLLPLPDVTLPQQQLIALDGGALQLATGRVVVLNLWATWCPPCRREMPMMTELAASMPEVDFVFANQGESNDRILGFLTRGNLPLAGMVRDPQGRLMAQLGAIGLPTTLVFDAEGRLVAGQMGEVSRAALTRMIAQATGD